MTDEPAPPAAQGEYEGLIAELLKEEMIWRGGGLVAEMRADLARKSADALAALQAERDHARLTLAHTDIGSLPNDWSLQQIAEARIDDLLKLREQVRDTCRRAERAEARIAALTEALTECMNQHLALWSMTTRKDGEQISNDFVAIHTDMAARSARAALAKGD